MLLGYPLLFGQSGEGELNFRYGFSYAGLPRTTGTAPTKIVLPGSLSYTAAEWLDLRIEADTLRSFQVPAQIRHTGVGDVSLAAKVGKNFIPHLRISVEYKAKIPVASAADTLGTGRYDHRFGLAASYDRIRDVLSVEGDVYGYIAGLTRTTGYKTFTAYAAKATYTPNSKSPTIALVSETDFVPANNMSPWEAYWVPALIAPLQIGRASCRERV